MDTREMTTRKVQSYHGPTVCLRWFRFMIFPEKLMEVPDHQVWENAQNAVFLLDKNQYDYTKRMKPYR